MCLIFQRLVWERAPIGLPGTERQARKQHLRAISYPHTGTTYPQTDATVFRWQPIAFDHRLRLNNGNAGGQNVKAPN